MTVDARELVGADASEVRVLIPTGYGLNCEAETAAGFGALGAHVESVHVADLLERGSVGLAGHHMLALVGGFSFGDHVASGRVFANRLRFRLGDALARFVEDGGYVLAICNGFQTAVKLGLLPALDRGPNGGLAAQTASLVSNDRLGYRNAWVRLRVDEHSPCVFTRGLADELLEMPSRHGEGKLVFADAEIRRRVEEAHLVPVRYADCAGRPTEDWPDNPNGSEGGAAGLCDPSGRTFGLMPHPEAYLYPENHPRWLEQRDGSALPKYGLGLRILANGLRAVLA